jgi:class 3 adenylate cyclase
MSQTRRLAAILAADVASYSRLMGEDEEGTLAALKAIRRGLADPKIKEHRGRIVKTTGDGLLLEFASVADAVRCAVEVQGEMAERTADVPPDRRIVLRMGINLGDIIKDGRDIYGDGVNIAARLEALAEPGGICVSQVVRDQVRDKFRIGRGFDHRRRAVGPNRTGNGTDLDPDGLHRRGAVVPRCAPQLCRRLRRVISYDHQQNRLVLAGGSPVVGHQ